MLYRTALLATCPLILVSTALGQSLSVDANAVVSHLPASANREFTVDVNLSNLAAAAVGLQATVAYDPAIVEYVGIAGGTDFSLLIYASHDSANSRIGFASGLKTGGAGAGITGGNVAKLTFRAIAGACADLDAVTLSTGSFPTRVVDSEGALLTYTESNAVSLTALGAVSLDAAPASVSVAADAGTTAGSLQTLSAPTAANSCGTALGVSFSRSDSLGANDYYPIGATTVTWTATDAAGNSASVSRTVTVANHQLLDAAVDLIGTVVGNSTRSIRIKAGASTQVVPVSMTGTYGLALGLQVPVAAGYACMSAKDTAHSLTDTAAPSVVGVHYSAEFELKQGDSNGDDLVDIIDFGIYIGDFGAAGASDISNFNGDLVVNSADFSFISVNFLQVGQSCGSYSAGTPRTRVSVKELRRAGLGHLAGSDLNRDGWLDGADVAHYLQFGIPTPAHGTGSGGNVAW
jgi:hypothetical protein